MGMYAMYQEVKKEDFKKLLESDDFFETIEDLEEKDGTELCDIDKMWDALHFLLNGLSAIHGAPEDNTERVIEIAKKLNEINFEDYLKDFDMNKFAENGIYPDIWSYDEEKEEIMEELSEHFENLKEFYNKVAENKNIVVVTIC